VKAIDLEPGVTYAYRMGRKAHLGQRYQVYKCIVLDNHFYNWKKPGESVVWNENGIGFTVRRARNTHIPIAREGSGGARPEGPNWELDLIMPGDILGTWEEHERRMDEAAERHERQRKQMAIKEKADEEWRRAVVDRMTELKISPLAYETESSRRMLTVHHSAVDRLLGLDQIEEAQAS
jgi:hypothetical protein